MRILTFLLLSASLFFLSACGATFTQTSARTLDRGKTEFTGTLGVFPVDEDYAPPVVPTAEVQVRHGVSDRVEIGGGLSALGISGRVKLGLIRSESATSGFNLSLDPRLGVAAADSNTRWAVHADLPLLFGFLFAGHELTVGPRVGSSILFTDPRGRLFWGGSLALAFKLGDTFRLTPEAGFTAPIAEDGGLSVFPTFGLGFTWGR